MIWGFLILSCLYFIRFHSRKNKMNSNCLPIFKFDDHDLTKTKTDLHFYDEVSVSNLRLLHIRRIRSLTFPFLWDDSCSGKVSTRKSKSRERWTRSDQARQTKWQPVCREESSRFCKKQNVGYWTSMNQIISIRLKIKISLNVYELFI